MNAFTLHADCSYVLLEGSKHIYLTAREYLPLLPITRLQIEKAHGTVHEPSECSHPLAPAAEAALAVCRASVHGPSPQSRGTSSGVKNLEQGEVKRWVKEGDVAGSLSSRNLQEWVLSFGSELKWVEMMVFGEAEQKLWGVTFKILESSVMATTCHQ